MGGMYTHQLHAADLSGVSGEYTFSSTGVGANSYIGPNGTVDLGFDSTIATGKPVGEMTLNFESGDYSFGISTIAGGQGFVVGTADAPVSVTVNVTGGTKISFGGVLADYNTLYGYAGSTSPTIYASTTVNINTTSTVSSLSLTTRGNQAAHPSFVGDQHVTITAGQVGISSSEAGSHSLSLGQKYVDVEGDVTYVLGALDADDEDLTFGGGIYGGVVGADSGNIIDGDVNITLNSGSYQSVIGASTAGTHTGTVTINFNGGTVAGVLQGSGGATVNGGKILNIGSSGTINANNIDFDSFTEINLAGTINLTSNLNDAVNIGFDGGKITSTAYTLSEKSGSSGTYVSTANSLKLTSLENATVTGLHLSVNDGQNITLTNVTLNSSSISSSIASSTGETAVTADDVDIAYIYKLSNITFSGITIGDSLTLNITLTGDALADYNAYLTAGSGYVGFELEGIELSALQDEDIDIIMNILDGTTGNSLFSNAALGVQAGASGNAVLYIPEPSTASLSLLALAGLLARRRRQAV